MKKNLVLSTKKELLTIVESEILQLGSWNEEQVEFIIRKKNDWETGEEFLMVTVIRKELKK